MGPFGSTVWGSDRWPEAVKLANLIRGAVNGAKIVLKGDQASVIKALAVVCIEGNVSRMASSMTARLHYVSGRCADETEVFAGRFFHPVQPPAVCEVLKARIGPSRPVRAHSICARERGAIHLFVPRFARAPRATASIHPDVPDVFRSWTLRAATGFLRSGRLIAPLHPPSKGVGRLKWLTSRPDHLISGLNNESCHSPLCGAVRWSSSPTSHWVTAMVRPISRTFSQTPQ